MFISPVPLFIIGWVGWGKKAELGSFYETWVRDSFSGYLVIDEIHDGPYTIFYAVDPHAKKRVAYFITEEGATEKTAREFLLRLRGFLPEVYGITTDGLDIYPSVIAEVFPKAVHQVCEFHFLKEMNRLVLRALARLRKGLKARVSQRKRGRPRKAVSLQQKQRYRQEERLRRKAKTIWENRYLFVKKHLSPAEEKDLLRLSRGFSELRALGEFVETVYHLFDRRCSTTSALEKLGEFRSNQFFARFPLLEPLRRKLMSPNLEKALEFLDDKLLEATSNAVERTNRRHRKMQKTVYRFRTKKMISARIKIDMLLDYYRREGPHLQNEFSIITLWRIAA